ncbi:MAG: hypothetical protein NC048_02180 [Bacteroides sp.]|nr:hypothetical protein [Bacteroides sp.]
MLTFMDRQCLLQEPQIDLNKLLHNLGSPYQVNRETDPTRSPLQSHLLCQLDKTKATPRPPTQTTLQTPTARKAFDAAIQAGFMEGNWEKKFKWNTHHTTTELSRLLYAVYADKNGRNIPNGELCATFGLKKNVNFKRSAEQSRISKVHYEIDKILARVFNIEAKENQDLIDLIQNRKQ